jgi:integrase
LFEEKVADLTVTAVFAHGAKKNRSGYYCLNLRLTLHRTSVYCRPVGLPKLRPEHWDPKKRLVKNHPSTAVLNLKLGQERTKIMKHYIEMTAAGKAPGLAELKAWYTGRSRPPVSSVNDFVRRHALEYVKDAGLSYRTLQTYRTLSVQLDQFNPNWLFSELDREHVGEFVKFLKGKKLRGVSIIKSLSRLNSMCREAAIKGLWAYDSLVFSHHRIKREPSQRQALTAQEIRALMDLPLQDRPALYRTRTAFVFQSLCGGLYHSDIIRLTDENLQYTNRGAVLVGRRYKNNEEFFIPVFLVPAALALIEAVRRSSPERWFSDLPTEPVYNRQLKEIARLAGIAKRVSNRAARHTYADLMISNNVPIAALSKAMGHTKTSTTEGYFRMNLEHMAAALPEREPIEI